MQHPHVDHRPEGRNRRRRLFAVAIVVPTLGSSLGIDGGAIFQILAVEELGLTPTVIGIGLALSTVSIPFQIRAARIPLERAVPNLQLFFAAFAVLCWSVAALVLFAAPGSTGAHAALAIAVVAEIAVSVLYATAWQPLLGYALSAADRQRVNSWGRATGLATMMGVVVLFGAMATGARAMVLFGAGLISLGAVAVIRLLPRPSGPSLVRSPTITSRSTPDRVNPTAPERSMTPILVAVGLLTFGAWPLLVTYTAEVLWPEINLGIIAAAQVGGSVVAALVWRPTTTGLRRRSRVAGAVLLLCTIVFAAVRTPVDANVAGAAVLALVSLAAAATSTVGLALLELTHLHTIAGTSVRRLTIFDVVASTSAQVGFLVSGVLISLSSNVGWVVDPYRLCLLITAGLLLVALSRLPPVER